MAESAGIVFAPVLVLELLVAAFAATLFGLVLGRPVQRLAYFVPAALVGAVFGQLIGEQMHGPGVMVGSLHLLEAALGAMLLLLIARRLGV